MVKVICLPLALAHVSHFFAEPEPWAYKQLTHFSVFEIFENLQLPALLLSLPPRVALFSERAPWAHKQSSRFTVFVISENSSSSVVLLPLAPVSLIVQLFDAFLAFSLLFGSFLLYVQEGSAVSIQGDMQIEAAVRLKNTLSDLPDLDISRNISFGAPPRIFLDPFRYLRFFFLPQIDRWWLLFFFFFFLKRPSLWVS